MGLVVNWGDFRRRRAFGGALLCLLGVSACSPTFNWREVRADGAHLLALMPCKPERAERDVPMTPAGVRLQLRSCSAGGVSFALAWAELDPGEPRAEVMARWHAASQHSLQVRSAGAQPAPGWTAWALAVPGADAVQAWEGPGLDHRAQPVRAQSAYFAQGNWVYQAAAYGAKLPQDAMDTFFGSLKIEPTR